MPVINVWSKVGVSVQTVLAAAVPITSITKANPAVVTRAAHGFTNGQVVKLSGMTGMSELDNKVVEVANVTTGTYELKGEDSTLYGTFASGNAQLVTFGAAAATIQDVNSSGGEAAAITVTTIHDDTEKQIPGTFSALSYSFGNLWDTSDAALIELAKASRAKATRSIRLTFSSGAKVYFDCYPSALLAPGGSTGGAVTTPTSFNLTGPITAYAS
jgi:hypothetical protein